MDHELPFFSVVVTTYNRLQQLAISLSALARQAYPSNCYEVIVVDDGSVHTPQALVATYQERLDLTLLIQDNQGPAAARNRGAQRARGTFLAFTDDDCAPAPTWLQTLAVSLNGSLDCAVGGRTVNLLTNNLFAVASQHLLTYLYSYYNTDPSCARFFASNNLALRATDFHEVGGFDSSFPRAAGEDRDFCARWLSRGYRLIYVPEAVVRHYHTLTPRRFWQQHVNYGRGAYHFHRLRACREESQLQLEPLSFYLGLLCAPFTTMRTTRAAKVAGLLLSAQVATSVGFWQERLVQQERRDG
ncbi:MAG: glycosyltransferase [Chloroflexota bacterium]|nr:glycosyltransferase [Chloroflexota bacterium]